jgi:hypothetical protein
MAEHLLNLLAGNNVAALPQDIAAINLMCATDLPGSESLSIPDMLSWLDDAANAIRIDKEEGYNRFLEAPGAFDNSQAKFCIVQMVTLLQQRLEVRYNPKWKDFTPENPPPPDYRIDANDMFLHAIINGVGGTCASLPFLYIAIGRRLGYPLKLVKAHRHLFVRWDDPEGKHWFNAERFNIEVTDGVHFLPDDHYKTWPREISNEDVDAGIYLKSLSPEEELAECLATRGHCLADNGRLAEAAQVFDWAAKMSPKNRFFAHSHQRLLMHLAAIQQEQAYLAAMATPPPPQLPTTPTWITDNHGREMLVQVIRPGHYNSQPMMGARIPLMPQLVQLPNGQTAHVQLPIGQQLQADWLRLPSGEYALIHRQPPNQLQYPATSSHFPTINQPTVPQLPGAQNRIENYERQDLIAKIEQLRMPHHAARSGHIPQLRLAMPSSPIRHLLTNQ